MAKNKDCQNTMLQGIKVNIVYAQKKLIWQRNITVPSDSTAISALYASSFFSEFPDHSIESIKIGIYGRICQLTQVLKHQDRLEVYRPLVFNPMESRRRRAQHKQRQQQK